MKNYYKEFVLTREELDHLSKVASEAGIRAYQNEQKRQQRAADNAHRMKQALKSYRDIKQIIMAGEEAPSGMGRTLKGAKSFFHRSTGRRHFTARNVSGAETRRQCGDFMRWKKCI